MSAQRSELGGRRPVRTRRPPRAPDQEVSFATLAGMQEVDGVDGRDSERRRSQPPVLSPRGGSARALVVNATVWLLTPSQLATPKARTPHLPATEMDKMFPLPKLCLPAASQMCPMP